MRYGREMIDLIELAADACSGPNKINSLTLSILSTLSTLSIDPFVLRARGRFDRRNSKLDRIFLLAEKAAKRSPAHIEVLRFAATPPVIQVGARG